VGKGKMIDISRHASERLIFNYLPVPEKRMNLKPPTSIAESKYWALRRSLTGTIK